MPACPQILGTGSAFCTCWALALSCFFPSLLQGDLLALPIPQARHHEPDPNPETGGSASWPQPRWKTLGLDASTVPGAGAPRKLCSAVEALQHCCRAPPRALQGSAVVKVFLGHTWQKQKKI